ncbi:MAG: shikimate dehydrogenase [Anaerolineaceae bacterium]
MNSLADTPKAENEQKVWRLGLAGFPVSHSLSPVLHQAALAAHALTGEYRIYSIPPEEVPNGFLSLFQEMREGRLDGLNITVPYKETVLSFLDQLSPAAQGVGAVNTIYFRDGQLVGDNTDIDGFCEDLGNLEWRICEVTNKKALVLGAGGAARSVVYVLLNDGWTVTISARRPEQAMALARDFSGLSSDILCVPLDERLSQLDVDLIVNTTPVGMYPNINASPWPAGQPLPPKAAIYDLIYFPAESLLMRAASCSRNGLGMLVEQAALAFEIWTGFPAPRAEMRRAAEQQLSAL